MPSLRFVLPHWLYWGILLLFPLLAMVLVARQRRRRRAGEPLLFIAYLFWLTAGFLGMHRFYLKSVWGFVFLPLFVVVIYCNGQVREAREDVSRTHAEASSRRPPLKRAQPAATPPRRCREERKALAEAQAVGGARKTALDAATKVQDDWKDRARDASGRRLCCC